MRISRTLTAAILATGLALGACAAVVAPAAGAAAATPTPGATVRIGLEAPLTGELQSIGEGMLDGARLAAAQLNAKGGIGGKQVEIVAIDDAGDAATGVAAAKAAIASRLDGIVGPYNSGVGAQTLPLYIAAGLVPVRLTSADSTNGLGVTLQPMTYQIAPVAAKALTTWKKAKSVAIVYDETQLYTKSVASALQQQLQSAGVTVAAFQGIQPAQRSYGTVLQQVAATKPDVIYLATYYPEGGLIAKEMYNAKLTPACLADYGAYSLGFISTAGKAAAQHCPVVGVPAPNEFKGSKSYVAAYRKKFGQAPGVWSPYTYDSVNLLAAAVAKAGGWTAAGLTTALQQISGFTGWTGPVAIDPTTGNREPATVVVLDTTKAGKFAIDPAWASAVGAS